MITHRVHCFSCAVSYEQKGPHPHCCGSCGSDRIGVHSDPTGDVWSVSVVSRDGPVEVHTTPASGVGPLVQTIIEGGVEADRVVVVTPPEAALGPSPVDLRKTQEMELNP